MAPQDPQYQIDGDELKTQRVMMRSLFDYMYRLAMQRREDPSDDFTSNHWAIWKSTANYSARKMSAGWCFSIVAAGLETTRDALAVGFLQLFRQPEQVELLRQSDKYLNLAADEFVRWTNPALQKFRIATRDYEMHGHTIREGGLGHRMARVGQSRRGGVRPALPVRCYPLAEQAYRLRSRRT